MHNQDIGVFCKIHEFPVGTVLIRTKHNRDTPRLDAVSKCGQVGVRDAQCSHADSVAIQHLRWLGLGHINDTHIPTPTPPAPPLPPPPPPHPPLCPPLPL